MSFQSVALQELSEKAFESFGKVISLPQQDKPVFSSPDFQYWKQVGLLDHSGATEIGILNVKRHQPLINQMERHAHTRELLVPLTSDFILIVAPFTNTNPESTEVKAFRVTRGQAVLINKNCWHWMPNPIDADGIILVIFKDNTSANDLIIEPLNKDCAIDI